MSDAHDSRRAFLRRAGCIAFTLGLPAALRALPIAPISGRRVGASQLYPIPAADAVKIDYDAQVILVRSQGRAWAFNLSCPHENAAVKWLPKDSRFQCTRHDSRYQPDGVYVSGRATRNLDRFAVSRQGGSIAVDLDHLFRSDKDASAWAAATIPV